MHADAGPALQGALNVEGGVQVQVNANVPLRELGFVAVLTAENPPDPGTYTGSVTVSVSSDLNPGNSSGIISS